jgi:hypothetical protein
VDKTTSSLRKLLVSQIIYDGLAPRGARKYYFPRAKFASTYRFVFAPLEFRTGKEGVEVGGHRNVHRSGESFAKSSPSVGGATTVPGVRRAAWSPQIEQIAFNNSKWNVDIV